jgi:hypothetical protein
MPAIDLSILNQRQTPAFFASSLATRPAFGFAGRIFIDSDVPSTGLYRDTGSAWVQIADPGAGTTGTLQQVTTNGKTTNQGITITAGGLNANNISLAQNTGTVKTSSFSQIMAANDIWEIYGIGNTAGLGQGEMVFSLGDDGSPYASGGERFRFTYDTNIVSGSVKDVFIVDYDLSYFNTSLGINTPTPTADLDIHSATNVIAQLNQTVATNNSLLAFQNAGSGLWRIGNFYNGGANDFGVFDVIGGIEPLRIKKTTGQVLIGTNTVGSGKLVVASSTGDNGVQIVGAAAPSLRIDNAESGPTKRAGFGISTATNNFIQGSADRDFCMFNGSTTASPILFGIYDTTNVQEAARISAARNFLIGKTTDNGSKLQVNGVIRSDQTNGLAIGNVLGYRRIQYGTSVSDAFSFLSDSDGFADIYYKNSVATGQIRTNFEGQSILIFPTTTNSARIQIQSSGGGNFVLGVDNSTGGNLASGTSAYSSVLTSGSIRDLFLGTNSVQRLMIGGTTGNILIDRTTDNGNKLQVSGNVYFSNLTTLAGTSTNVSTSAVQVATNSGIGVGAFYFAAWFNNIGGAQGVAVLMARGSTVVTISNSDGSGAGVIFSASLGALVARTTSGTVTMGVTQINM